MILGFDVFPSWGLYGPRPLTHFAARKMAPGCYWIEWSSLTLECEVPAWLRRAIAPVCLVGTLSAGHSLAFCTSAAGAPAIDLLGAVQPWGF